MAQPAGAGDRDVDDLEIGLLAHQVVGQSTVHEAGARAQGAQRGHGRRAGHAARASDDQHGAHRALVVGVALGPHEQADGVGAQGEDVGLLVAGRRNADRHDHHVAGATVAGAHEVTDLGGVQGDGQIGQHRRTAQLAGGGVDTRGDVERHDGGG